MQGASEELMVYFSDSFGSNVRLDYGTGHEVNFAQILFCLYLLGLINEADFEAAVHHVFYKYIALMRKIQTVYWLEPAGSQGVWGLDDHHFLPFLFGAAELINHPVAKLPSAINNEMILEDLAQDYMYLSKIRSSDCIQHIKKVKTGGRFHETSPVLNDIAGATSWNKVAGVDFFKIGYGEDVPSRSS